MDSRLVEQADQSCWSLGSQATLQMFPLIMLSESIPNNIFTNILLMTWMKTRKDTLTKFVEDTKPGSIINRHRQSQFFKVTEEAEM